MKHSAHSPEDTLPMPSWDRRGEYHAGTSLAPAPMRARAESFVGLREAPRADANTALDALVEEQLTLTMGLLCLAAPVAPYDPSARAAAQTMAERIADLARVRDALDDFQLDLFDPRVAPLLRNDGPIVEYLRGIYTWLKGVIRAFEDLGPELWALSPNWLRLRSRLEDADAFYMKNLEPLIRAQAARLRHEAPEIADPRDPLHAFRPHLDALLASTRHLHDGLQRRFG
jgi:hypothetical protein